MKFRTCVRIFVWAFVLLGLYVAWDVALDLLNWPSDAAVVGGYAILVGIFCAIVSIALLLVRKTTAATQAIQEKEK